MSPDTDKETMRADVVVMTIYAYRDPSVSPAFWAEPEAPGEGGDPGEPYLPSQPAV